MSLEAKVHLVPWKGHGEGGSLAEIRIEGWDHEGYPWNSSSQDIAHAEAVARYVNRVLAAFRGEENGIGS